MTANVYVNWNQFVCGPPFAKYDGSMRHSYPQSLVNLLSVGNIMKVYVAGKCGTAVEVGRVRELQDAVVAAGGVITHDWTRQEGITPTPTGLTGERAAYLARCAKLDIDGVLAADAVVALIDDEHYAYRGTFTEIGAALGSRRRVVIVASSPPERLAAAQNCFFHHPDIVRVATTSEALGALGL
jgi:nucleoside 2-deoxyribosyltransferase